MKNKFENIYSDKFKPFKSLEIKELSNITGGYLKNTRDSASGQCLYADEMTDSTSGGVTYSGVDKLNAAPCLEEKKVVA